MKKTLSLIFILISLTYLSLNVSAAPVNFAAPAVSAASARTQPLIIDHNTTDITAIPQAWIVAAKANLHIAYGHTSHGSQITTGMTGLVAFANGGGKGLSLPTDIFQYDHDGNNGGTHLHLFEGSQYDGSGDLAYDAGYIEWIQRTYDYLGTVIPATGRGANHPEINVLMWSWCGQLSDLSAAYVTDNYLGPMAQLELDYPGITFVYMTGHADGTGESGNLHLRNQQIRQYAIANNKVLFDFYDFDTHDPDDVYYGNKGVTDELWYDSDNNGSKDKNWGTDWQNTHTLGDDWYTDDCAHSMDINCNQKAYAAWWLWSRLAGWEGGSSAPPTPVYLPLIQR